MKKSIIYILGATCLLFSHSFFVEQNTFSKTFADIDQAQNAFLSDLKYDAKKQAQKKSLEVARIKKEKEREKRKAYISRRISEYNAYEKSLKTVSQKQHETVINANQSLKVTATAYTSHSDECNSDPTVGAWDNPLIPGSKSIAVSRDLLKKYGMKNGTKVRISGLEGIYRVVDTMHERYQKRIDIYMGMDKSRALRWGAKDVLIQWD